MWTFNCKNRSIINKVRTFELVVSFIVRQKTYSIGSPGAPKRNQWPPPLKSPQGLIMEVTTAYAADRHHVCMSLFQQLLCEWFHDSWQGPYVHICTYEWGGETYNNAFVVDGKLSDFKMTKASKGTLADVHITNQIAPVSTVTTTTALFVIYEYVMMSVGLRFAMSKY